MAKTTPDMYMKTCYVEVEKRSKLKPWTKYNTLEQWRELTKPWEYKGHKIPNKFRWNGSNSPRMFWRIISPWKNPKASCLHDFLCSKASYYMEMSKEINDNIKSDMYRLKALELRKEADKLYGELVGGFTGKLGYAGVRAGSALGQGW